MKNQKVREKVLVTGAAGMLGVHLCRELMAKGYAVRAFCQNKKQVDAFELPVTEILFGDILDKEAVDNAVAGCDYVIHAAAVLKVWPERSSLVREVNVNGTINVMEAAQKHNIKRMVQIGSASSFGMKGEAKPSSENDTYGGWRFGLDYLDSKYEAQLLLQKEYKRSGFPVVIINPTFMIGPFDSGPTSGRMIISICKGSLPAVSTGGKNFVYTGDVASAAVSALVNGRTGECYIAGNENMSYSEFYDMVAGIGGLKKKVLRMPSVFVLMAGAAASLASRINGKEPMLSLPMSRIALMNQFVDCKKAVTELGMPQTPLNQAVQKSIDWYREKKYL